MPRPSSAMPSLAILCLLLMESFLTADLDRFTEPILKSVRSLEKAAVKYTRAVIPPGLLKARHKMARFYLFTPEYSSGDGRILSLEDDSGFRYFDPKLDTKVIIHGFLDKAKIARWMHQMKDEFLLLDDFNVILVDWSLGNFIPYTRAAENTEQVGEEISKMLAKLRDQYGAKPEKFHLIGHSLGSHVAGYVGEHIKGLKRITGLDPAMYLFKDASPRSKLDRSDAEFVDVIHTDGGGIGMMEPIGHVDFFPNGGQIQTGCTASNSLRALLEHGVVEGVRSVICSHMRAPFLFTDSINSRRCQKIAYKCAGWKRFARGACDGCGEDGSECAVMGYHMDTRRNYGNFSKYYLLTADSAPYCGYEYKIMLSRSDVTTNSTLRRRGQLWSGRWSRSDVLHVSLYGSADNTEIKIEGNDQDQFQESRVVFSQSYLGDVMGAIIRWGRQPITRTAGLVDALVEGPQDASLLPSISSIRVSSLKTQTQYWRIAPIVFDLCVSPLLAEESNQQGATFRNEYC